MSLAGIYFFLALLSAYCVLTAIVQARRIYWLVPVYFLSAWLCGELALIHLVWQLVVTALLALTGGFSDPLAQLGLGIFAFSWLGLIYLHCQSMDAPNYLRPALQKSLGQNYRADIPLERQHVLSDDIHTRSWFKPFHFKRDGVRVDANIAYADAGKRNLLDIYRPQDPREGGFPVLLQVHGGAWMIGEKEQQGKPLMYHMAQRGWLCVAINYRLSPKAAFPAHIIDVKKAIAWVKEHIRDYGGNPDFIAITGGSAGGHLSSLAALTPNRTLIGSPASNMLILHYKRPCRCTASMIFSIEVAFGQRCLWMTCLPIVLCSVLRQTTPSCGMPRRHSAMFQRTLHL